MKKWIAVLAALMLCLSVACAEGGSCLHSNGLERSGGVFFGNRQHMAAGGVRC